MLRKASNVRIGLTKNYKVVNASEDLPKGTLVLPPCVPQTSRVYDKSTRPHRVPVEVTEKSSAADAKPDTRKSVKGDLRAESGRSYITCLPHK